MGKVSQGKCAVCGKMTEVVKIDDGKSEANICQTCANKLDTSPEDFLLKHGSKKKGLFDSILSVFSPKPPKPAEENQPVPRKREGKALSTSIDDFLELVNAEEKTGLISASRKLGTKPENVEKWAIILHRRGLIELVYPQNPFESPYARKLKEEKK